VAKRLGYISEELAATLEVTMKQVGAPLSGLIRSERNKALTQTAGLILIAFSMARLVA
jgi:hypothetical protein